MDDFEEVARRLRRVNVSAPDHGDAHGVLVCNGDESVIELTGNFTIDAGTWPGWFDLRLRQSDGQMIYIHNAVRTSMTFGRGDEPRSATLFPNFVVDRAEGLDADGRCRKISFGLDGWLACFAYNYFETLDFSGPVAESLRETLETARHAFARDEPFLPHEVYVANHFGTLVDFEVEGRRYSIFARIRHSGSRHRLNNQVQVIGSIEFPEATDLDAATDACWDWRRYFNQMAMAVLPFTGMSVAASREPQARLGNLYLPNGTRSLSAGELRAPHASDMPLNRWDDRVAAGEAMRSWLSRVEERRFFRAALDRVLARPGHIAIEDAVTLCAGIETLSELSTREGLPTAVLDAMVTAALGAAADGGLQLDASRVRGVLGSLQNDDLRRRLRRLASIAAPDTQQDVVERWIAVILPLRTLGAHGRRPATDHDFIAGPAVAALAALCARYDLQSAGVPDRCASGAANVPRQNWQQALMGLRSLQEAGIR